MKIHNVDRAFFTQQIVLLSTIKLSIKFNERIYTWLLMLNEKPINYKISDM